MPDVFHGPTRLWYDSFGDGPALLLLHGYRDTGIAWRHQIPAFASGHRVIVPDLRGHGRSDVPPDDDYSFPTLAADVVAVLDHAGAAQAVVVGHSLGGMILAQLVLDHPERVQAAVFSSTSPLPSDRTRRTTLTEQVDIIQRGGMTELARLTQRWRRAPGETDHDLQLAMETVRTMSPRSALAYARLMRDMPGWDSQLAGNPIRALVIHGSLDSTNIQSGSDRLLELLPNAVDVEIGGAGHYVQHTHPREYNRALQDFLSTVQGVPERVP